MTEDQMTVVCWHEASWFWGFWELKGYKNMCTHKIKWPKSVKQNEQVFTGVCHETWVCLVMGKLSKSKSEPDVFVQNMQRFFSVTMFPVTQKQPQLYENTMMTYRGKCSSAAGVALASFFSDWTIYWTWNKYSQTLILFILDVNIKVQHSLKLYTSVSVNTGVLNWNLLYKYIYTFLLMKVWSTRTKKSRTRFRWDLDFAKDTLFHRFCS